MDEARASCVLDLSGRTYFVWDVALPRGSTIGTWDVELAAVFFEAFARGAQCNLHFTLERGENLHHIVPRPLRRSLARSSPRFKSMRELRAFHRRRERLPTRQTATLFRGNRA